MRGLEAEKAAIRALVLKQLGIDPGVARVFAGQASVPGMESALHRLPSSFEPQSDLQDPATGDFYFMLDYSAIDGDDVLQ